MRTAGLTVAGIFMTIGLAITGWVNPTVGVICLFGGASLWIVCQKKTPHLLERALASKSKRQTLDEQSARKKHIQEQFAGLSAAEKEVVRHVKLNGHILPQQVASYLASQGFADSDGIVDRVRNRTPFLLGSFSGEFSINPELKELLDELLNPPLFSPVIRVVALAVVVLVVIGLGILFRKYIHPAEVAKETSQPNSASQSVTPQRNPPTEMGQQAKSTQPADGQKRDVKRQSGTLAKPSQDNSVHVEHGAKIEQTSSGDCSSNSVGGSVTMNCPPPIPTVATMSGNGSSVCMDNVLVKNGNFVKGIGDNQKVRISHSGLNDDNAPPSHFHSTLNWWMEFWPQFTHASEVSAEKMVSDLKAHLDSDWNVLGRSQHDEYDKEFTDFSEKAINAKKNGTLPEFLSSLNGKRPAFLDPDCQ